MSIAFYTIPDVAKMLSMGEDIVRSKINAGEIPAVDLSPRASRRNWRIREDELFAWLGSNSNTVAAQETDDIKEFV